jgi:SAM-dependent methyltransferase
VHDADGYFGETVAATYDESESPMFDAAVVQATVDFLAELAEGGRALELGIGTGRIALPLATRGVEVHGIDLSHAMVARLKGKPGGEGIRVAIGDFATTKLDGTFRLAYLVFNTIMNLTSQAAQVACFRNVADHLEPGGRFVIEVAVPDLRRLPPGERYVVFDASETHWGVDEYDVVNQGLVSHHFEKRGGRDDREVFEKSRGPFRYVWPSELDLMADIAGLVLRERWAGWGREPFTSESRSHVSVWQKPSQP